MPVTAAHRRPRGDGGVRAWPLWSIPARARLFVLLVDLVAIGWTVALVGTTTPSAAETRYLIFLTIMGLGYAEVVSRTERLREFLGARTGVYSDQTSIWTLAAVLVAPAGWAALLAGALYGQALLQGYRSRVGTPYRTVFTGATVMITVIVASAALRLGGTETVRDDGARVAPAVLVAGAVYTTVGFGLVLAGMWLHRRPPSVRHALPALDAAGYEVATLVLGMVTALLVVRLPLLSPLVLVLAIFLHRGSLVSALHEAVRTDPKTGLLTSAAWTEQAIAALLRARRTGSSVTVLFCDIDHFKRVNDTYGHLVGDQVLTTVSACLRRELRDRDRIGRFGGEEFVIFLEDLAEAAALLVAQRLRAAVEELQFDSGLELTVSVGLVYQDADRHDPGARMDTSIQDLLDRADTALRVAKAGGRNQVRLAGPPGVGE